MKNEILSAFEFRHACKEFDGIKKIPDEDFKTILEAGHLSPSSFGLEPWKFLVIQNMALREKIKEVTWGGKKQLPTASHFIVILYRKAFFMRYNSDYILEFMKNVQHIPEEGRISRLKFIETFRRMTLN